MIIINSAGFILKSRRAVLKFDNGKYYSIVCPVCNMESGLPEMVFGNSANHH